MMPWDNKIQSKNMAWFLPRPKPDRYVGGMPLYAEEWLLKLAEHIYGEEVKDDKILQPFGGMGKRGIRVDLRKETNPDVLADAHDLPFSTAIFKIVLCDPPYSNEEARNLYNTPPLNYRKWATESIRVLEENGILILYHKKILPNPNPPITKLLKRVFIGSRTWHLPRVAHFYKKVSSVNASFQKKGSKGGGEGGK